MAIVPLEKVTLYGAETQKSAVLEHLQELGCIHLIHLGSPPRESAAAEGPAELQAALTYLRLCPEKRQPVRREPFHLQLVVDEILEVKRQAEDTGDERDLLQKAIRDLQPWGEFRLPEHRLDGVEFWFYVLPIDQFSLFAAAAGRPAHADVSGLAWHEVNRDHQNVYLVVLSAAQPTGLPGKQVELDRRPLSELRRRWGEVEDQLEELHHRRVGLTRWYQRLLQAFNGAADAAAVRLANARALDQGGVFALQGWIPQEASTQIQQFAQQHGLALTLQQPDRRDRPPTLLRNPEAVTGSEHLVTFYKTPDYRAWDPSLVAYLSFAVFFAMILADAGYAALLGLVLVWFWGRLGRTQSGRRARRVLVTVVACAVVYGVICGSYLGLSPAEDSLLGKFRIVDATAQRTMIPLTVALGVVHLSLANLVIAGLNWGHAAALGSLGWVAVLFGGLLAGLSLASPNEFLDSTGVFPFAGSLVIGGLVAVFLFSSQRPLVTGTLKDHLLRLGDGLKGLAGVSGLFGDVLSYLRLFALGLSSAKLAETFNSLARGAWDHAGFGVLVAIGIFLLGHTLNFLLCIMSGVVHGLRLNCIEFFKWGLPEEGYLFSAFARRSQSP